MGMTPGASGSAMTAPNGIVGNSSGTAPATGNVGSRVASVVATGGAVTLTTTVIADVTSITLNPGVWDISFLVGINSTSGSPGFSGETDIFVGTVAGNNSTNKSFGDNVVTIPAAGMPTSSSDVAQSLAGYRVSPTVQTTYYLKLGVTYSAGTSKAYGRLSAVLAGN